MAFGIRQLWATIGTREPFGRFTAAKHEALCLCQLWSRHDSEYQARESDAAEKTEEARADEERELLGSPGEVFEGGDGLHDDVS
jgi:hypothetical protein